MLLITEEMSNQTLITESKDKELYIKGVFAQSDVSNNNGRIYPRKVMENALNQYRSEWIDKNRAIGENNHPQSPQPDMTNASILIKEMIFSGNDVVGKAKGIHEDIMFKAFESIIRTI